MRDEAERGKLDTTRNVVARVPRYPDPKIVGVRGPNMDVSRLVQAPSADWGAVPGKNRIAAGGEIADRCREVAAEGRAQLPGHAVRLVAGAVDAAAAGAVSGLSTWWAVMSHKN